MRWPIRISIVICCHPRPLVSSIGYGKRRSSSSTPGGFSDSSASGSRSAQAGVHAGRSAPAHSSSIAS